MRQRQIVSLTTDDGAKHVVTQERHPARSYGAKFVIVFTAAMAEASQRIKSVVTLRLLLVLPEHLNFTDFRQVRNVSLAERLKTDAGSISRGFAELLAIGVVEREGKGPRTAWRLSSDWGWNGTADQWHTFRAGRMKNKTPPSNHRGNTQRPDNVNYGKRDQRDSISMPSKPASMPAGMRFCSQAQSMS
jgi:hypothetical protein